MKRVNITLDEDTLLIIDAQAERFNSNRSEVIRAMFAIADELQIFDNLEKRALEKVEDMFGESEYGYAVSMRSVEKAAREFELTRQAW